LTERRFLFVCSQNRLRSPTAEQIFADWPGLSVSSAGTNHDAENPLTAEWVEWAETIFVMERAHLNKVRSKFRRLRVHGSRADPPAEGKDATPPSATSRRGLNA